MVGRNIKTIFAIYFFLSFSANFLSYEVID
jgi:hypothetical protein